MASEWAKLPYQEWSATCDTLHAHTQVLGKLAAALAAPEPQLQHAALRLTARGWETLPLPAPDESGALVVALDLHTNQAVVEHSDGDVRSVALTPNRPVGVVTRGVLEAVRSLGGEVEIDPTPQEVPWSVPLDEDDQHSEYDTAQVTAYFAAATRAALALAAFRAPYRGRSTPVNAWWGSFDLAVGLFSGRSVVPSSKDFIQRNAGDAQQVEIGWWPGSPAYPHAAFYAYAHPAPDGFDARHPDTRGSTLGALARRVHPGLGRRLRQPRPTRGRRRLRPLGVPARLHGVRMESCARRHRPGNAAARHLKSRGGSVPPMPAISEEAVLAWYSQNGRDLPWRHTRDPYAILVSEVMLQQTQVSRVLPRYLEWLERWPTVESLAAAPAADVIRAWSGLGYNRRAINLHRTAQAVAQRGGFPRQIPELEVLPGIGPYTARALACFAFGAQVSAPDVNARRVLGRAFGDPDHPPPPGRAFDWNQALFDLGSTVCLARRPRCGECPLATRLSVGRDDVRAATQAGAVRGLVPAAA